ncbi:cilia- and flagella-associated protein 43-like [Neodiprion virginianus]|uniref:cilia- and flagella-associated protein 43-like n=1 Tax=Neodiprion virginianus TaxID=2961670 RepID=UPI001EE73413|nr:cilia- and flagella-associated protein 43-like [Neodiprion virginianus]
MKAKTSEWKSHWIRGGKIPHVAWIGKDVLAWCSGVHIIFYDVVQKTEKVQSYVKHSQGEGACCLSGHPTLPLFAFAEKVSNPRVLVYNYPSMKRISECLKGGPSGYLATAFMEHEHLITLASYPHFQLAVWSWRTGERFTTMATHIKDIDRQMIATTYSGHTMIAQLGKESGKLTVWQMRICGKIVSLKFKDVKLPHGERINAATWSPEPGPPTLGILDESCHMYVLQHDTTVPTKIAQTQRCSECVDIEASDICWYRGGLVLKTTFCQIRYYKKTTESNHWYRIWMVKLQTHPYLLTSHPFKTDRLFFHTLEGDLIQLEVPDEPDTATPGMVTHLQRGGFYRFFNWIYPWGHHLTAVDNDTDLGVLETHTGKEICRINLEMSGSVSRLTSRRDLPLVALTSNTGEFTLVGICEPKQPLILAQYHLHREDLNLLKFSYSGNYIAAGFSLTGTCFCIASKVGSQFEVMARLEVNRQISDVLLYDNMGHLRLFVLCVTSRHAVISNQILLYDLPNGQTHFSAASCIIELRDSFQNLQYSPVSVYQVLGSPYLTRQLQVLGFRGWQEVTLLEATPSDHQVRQTKIFSDSRWITTCSRDGIVVVRKGDKLRTRVAFIMSHHRQNLGVVKGIMKPSGDVIISLGHDGSLVCTKLFEDSEPEDSGTDDRSFTELRGVIAKESEWRTYVSKDDYATLDPGVVKMLTQARVHFAPASECKDQTWIEWKRSLKIAAETKEHAATRASIQSSIAALKATVAHLINVNEACAEIEQLPISAFDLDKVSRDQKLKAARDEREDVRCMLEWNCAGMDRVADWIKESFWEKQQVQAQSIYSIFGRFKVLNYPTVPTDREDAILLNWARFSKQFTNSVVDFSTNFYPWIAPFNKVQDIMAQSTMKLEQSLSVVDEKQRMDGILEEDEEDAVVDEVELLNQRMLEGMTTYRFIEPSEHYYSQFELYSYAQMMTESQMVSHDVQRLRAYFNKLFNDVYAIKEREMNLVMERNDRIRHIDSELYLLFNQRVPEVPQDPVWDQTETPESLVKVVDSEVEVAPYISPSAQDILNKQATEANRLRLLLLADDFRERALTAMMDGVLEVRWEDLIKKDILKPQCMLTKTTDAYSAEDVLAVQQYEKEVETLSQEREKYKRILEADYSKVSGSLEDGIKRFEQRLREFFVTRIRVESAIQQLGLRFWRGCYRNMRRQQMYESEERLKLTISQKEAEIVSLSEEVRRQQSAIADLKGHYDTACNREKWQEKKFKTEFPGLAKVGHDLLKRHYKRRPRSIQKAIPSTYLKEMGKAVLSVAKPFFLMGECLDYLKALDALDVRPASLPPFIDPMHWDHLVRLRRLKVDSEMRVKSALADIAEAEHTVVEFNKLIANLKTEIEMLGEKLNAERLARVNFDQDVEVQFVLKMGQIEVALNSDASTATAILIPRSVIEEVNVVISIAGTAKLNAMKKTINFGRGINFKEWDHKTRKMRIEDLREELYCVERITVTKEVQEYLKRKAKGFKEDRTQQQLERELELLRRNWEKQLMDWVYKLAAIGAKITAIKKKNSLLDKRIGTMNVVRCEMELQRDVDVESKALAYRKNKMDVLAERSRLVRKLQDNYSELLVLQTEYELLRLRRFPAFKFFKTLDDDLAK